MDETKNSKPQPVAWQVMSGDQSEREFSIKDMAYDYVREQGKSGYRISLWIRPLYAEPLPAPTVQEPVGVFAEDDDIGHVRLIPRQQLKDGDKLYTTPPAAPVQVIPLLNNPGNELRWGADGFWSLHYAGTLIRFLDKYERNFVDSAIAAARGITKGQE
jgi:hypothetical protein